MQRYVDQNRDYVTMEMRQAWSHLIIQR